MCSVVNAGAAQDGALAAELLLHLYRSTRSSDLLIMLSELQVSLTKTHSFQRLVTLWLDQPAACCSCLL